LGFGFGTEPELFDYHGWRRNEWVYTGGYMHNSYLGLALQVGIPGALLFFLPLVFLLIREVRQVDHHHRGVRVAFQSVVLTGMTSAFLSSWLYSMGNHNSLLFWTSVMLLVRFRAEVGTSDANGPNMDRLKAEAAR
jgi:O-antigen ligase